MTNAVRSLAVIALAVAGPQARAASLRAYIGTYSTRGSEGIYVCDFDPASGAFGSKRVAAPYKPKDGVEFKNASFLAFHPSRPYLYAVSEVSNRGNQGGGAVLSFTIDQRTGQLYATGEARSGGDGPCHLALDATGWAVLVANYGAGTVGALRLDCVENCELQDGSLQVVDHPRERRTASGVDPSRQEGPHAHQVVLDPKNRFALVCDLGLDRIYSYRFDAKQGGLLPDKATFAQTAPGAGPRHLAFHPDGKLAYVINELNSTVTGYHYDDGALKEFQTISTLPKDVQVDNTCAEIAVHPNGKFLYASNRGHDSIAMFSIDPASGKLTPLGHQATGGRTPRHFTLDPRGAYVLAANQDSDSITVHRINQTTGRLEQTEHTLDVPAPVCVLFAPVK